MITFLIIGAACFIGGIIVGYKFGAKAKAVENEVAADVTQIKKTI